MSDTPRVDNEAASIYGVKMVSAHFARTLERELNRQYEENVARIHAQALAENERDSLKADCAKWVAELEKANRDFCDKAGEVNQLRAEVERLREKNTAWALGVEQNNTDIVDMQRDEFKRIIALTSDTEIQGLCKRAIATIEQTVPVIVQRDQLERSRDQWRAVAELCRNALNGAMHHGCSVVVGGEEQQYQWNPDHGTEAIAAYENLNTPPGNKPPSASESQDDCSRSSTTLK